MRYKHDCDTCVSLGEYEEYDLYHCYQKGMGATVVARYGDEPHEYLSGMWASDPVLEEAKRRAKEKIYKKYTS